MNKIKAAWKIVKEIHSDIRQHTSRGEQWLFVLWVALSLSYVTTGEYMRGWLCFILALMQLQSMISTIIRALDKKLIEAQRSLITQIEKTTRIQMDMIENQRRLISILQGDQPEQLTKH